MILLLEILFLQLIERNTTLVWAARIKKSTVFELQQSLLHIFVVVNYFCFNGGGFVAQKSPHLPLESCHYICLYPVPSTLKR